MQVSASLLLPAAQGSAEAPGPGARCGSAGSWERGGQKPSEFGLEDGPRNARKRSVLSAWLKRGSVALSPPGILFSSTETELG